MIIFEVNLTSHHAMLSKAVKHDNVTIVLGTKEDASVLMESHFVSNSHGSWLTMHRILRSEL